MIEDMDKPYRSLAAAVVLQAVRDWRALCNGKTQSTDRNFPELTKFFENEANIYLSETGLRAEEILKKQQGERRKAER